jgi:outer membrane receptor protein involved in Fe transport
MKRFGGQFRHGLAAALLASTAVLGASPARAQQLSIDIPAQSAAEAITNLGQQTGTQILFDHALLSRIRSHPVHGTMSVRAALAAMLKGSNFEVATSASGALIVRPRGEPGNAPAGAPGAAADRQSTSSLGSEADSGTKAAVEGITVTGSRIRGAVNASETITIDAKTIKEEGFADLGEAIRSIPQNFSGGQNPGVTRGASSAGTGNGNVSGGSALNLRGLGPDASLTLLNGRRLVYDGFTQGVDINAIPVEAVDRIEIVPDGASAIYGSDAVGGVANVILKRDFDGLTIGARYGGATEGGQTTREFSATGGAIWSTGGIMAAYKYTSADPIYAEQRSYTDDIPEPTTIYPGIKSSDGLLTVHQSFGDTAELRVDAIRNHRDLVAYLGYPGFYYSQFTKVSSYLLSPNLRIFLPYKWSATLGGTFGKNSSATVQDYLTTSSSTFSADYCYCNKGHSYDIDAEGPLFPIGGGFARLAVGIGARSNYFAFRDYTISATDAAAGKDAGKQADRFGYAELNLPLVSPNRHIKAIRRLELNAAVRIEDYDNFGTIFTPKIGLIYAPSEDLALKFSWGKSFKVPTLYQQYSENGAYLLPAATVGGSGYPSNATALLSYGGNPDLKPEWARTWSASLAIHPKTLPRLKAELTGFHINYIDRVVAPLATYLGALNNPNYAQFFTYSPTAQQQAALLAKYSFFNYTGAAYDPNNVVVIISDQFTNAERQRITGLDLTSSYRFDLGDGRLTLRGSGSWLKSSQQNSAGQSFHEVSGTIFNPAKYRGRIGLIYALNGFTSAIFANYIGGVTSNLTTATEKGNSFTTVDFTLRYEMGKASNALSGLTIELSAQNVLNQRPPFYTPTSTNYPPYDSTNYSAIGRFLGFSISKHF